MKIVTSVSKAPPSKCVGRREAQGAYRLIQRGKPFTPACGRNCTHPCKFECNRSNYDAHATIHEIKRFVSDGAFEKGVITRRRQERRQHRCQPERPPQRILPDPERLCRGHLRLRPRRRLPRLF